MSDRPPLLGLAGAAFPAGSFGHSSGPETAIVHGRIHDGPTLPAAAESDLIESAALRDAV
jgi:urease accessory protein UreF